MNHSYKLTINKANLQRFCDTHTIDEMPDVQLCTNIPLNGSGPYEEPLGDYYLGRIRVKVLVDMNKLPRRLSDKKKRLLLRRMNQVLYHELRHHIQYTKMREFYIEGRKGEYQRRPIEKDARSFARRQVLTRDAIKYPILEITKKEG